jgi:hypothetical protein
MKKTTFMSAIAAICLGAAASTPASAAIYNYTMTNNDILSINSSTNSATFTGATINAAMVSSAFATFAGGAAPNFTAVLSDLTGTRLVNGTWVTDNPLFADTTHPQKLIMSGTGVNLWAWWGNPITGGDYLTTIKSYSVNPGTSVPEPGMAALLALGAGGLFMARRRRKAQAAA